jgi:rhodanese-related sulfurtransferase
MPRKNQNSTKRNTNQPGLRLFPWIWIGVAVVVVVVVGVSFALSAGSPSGSSTSGEISIAQAYQDIKGGAFVVDVRTADEWNQSHIAGAILIPLDQLANRLAEVPRDREVIVVCRTGVRSAQGLTILKQAGYTNAASMTGGLAAWQAAGYRLTNPQ